MKINFILNGKDTHVEAPGNFPLLNLLRDTLGLTGTKCGCDTGNCGVCAVILDGKLINSCMVLASTLEGRQVITIEGIHNPDGGLSDLQESFLKHGAVQCGFCTPAMVLAGEAILRTNPNPKRDEIRAGISNVLCRCTGYQQIIDAIEDTAHQRHFQVEKSMEKPL
jgi:aerobic carbon-monoxide dehydrogenase small subunit